MRPRQLSATMTTSSTSEGSRCRTFSWLIKMRSGECPCLPAPFALAHFSGLAGGAAALSSSSSPQHDASWEWERGGKQCWLVGPPPVSLLCCPHWDTSRQLTRATQPLGAAQDCDPLVGVGHYHPQSPGPGVAVVSQRQRVKPDKNSQDLRVV